MLNRILIAVLLIGGALGYTWWSQQNLKRVVSTTYSEHLLKTMPDAVFTTLEGEAFNLASQKHSEPKAVLVHFWATWCGPCEAELPELLTFIEVQPTDVAVLIVAVNDEVPKIKKFMSQLKLPVGKRIHWLLDNTQIHREAFGTTKLPESYLFAGDGTMLRKLVGPQKWKEPQFFDMLKPFSP